jgi:hypothetical protein
MASRLLLPKLKAGETVIADDEVSADEPCYMLTEQNLVWKEYPGTRRTQVLYVPRHGIVGIYKVNMGASEDFGSAGLFTIPGGLVTSTGQIEILHTVGELREIAHRLRESREEMPVPTDLVQLYYDQYR